VGVSVAVAPTYPRRRYGDCIVWLRLALTSLPHYEVTHGQVTFYNAAYLSGFLLASLAASREPVLPASYRL